MKKKRTIPVYRKEIVALFSRITNTDLMGAFLEDILTPQEFEDIALRWQLVRQLHKGVRQRDIAKNLGISIEKVTRGSRELRDTGGGFGRILRKI